MSLCRFCLSPISLVFLNNLVSSANFNIHVGLLWARTIATHGPFLCLSNAMHWPLDCHLCICSLPHVGQLSASYAPLVCHMWATCWPDNGHMWATRGPALQNACGPHVLKWEIFQLPHVGLVWPTCGMFAGYMCRHLHFPKLNNICHFSEHLTNLSMSSCRYCLSPISLVFVNNLVSSANFNILPVTPSSKSLM